MASTLTKEDIRLLEKTIVLRERLVDNFVTTKLTPSPDKISTRDIDSVTNLLESIDRSIISKAKITIEEANSRITEETQSLMRDILVDLHRNKTVEVASTTTEPPVYKSVGMEVSEGELIVKKDNQDIEQYLG